MNIDDLASVAQIVSVIGALLAFIITFSVKIIKRLDAIAAQQKPNGGASLRDAVDRLNAKVDVVAVRIDSVERNVANLRGAYDEHTRSNKDQA